MMLGAVTSFRLKMEVHGVDEVSNESQISRSPKMIDKTRFELWLWDINYDWLFRAAQAEGKTMARKLNELIRQISSK